MCSSPRTRYWYSPPASSASREQRVVAERERVQPRGLLGDLEQADALDVARRAGEILVDERAAAGPTASKICAPQYDWYVEMPILDITL